jgi:hypothetical protein
LLIGHSYCCNFEEELARELNLPIRPRWFDGQTSEVFIDFLRQPELLDGVRVVVWITTTQHLTHFWGLPPEIMAAK